MKANSKKVQTMGKFLFVALVIALAIAPAILTSKFGFGILPILTESMEPNASAGDVYITKLVAASDLRVGDIIAVNNQVTGTYYSHRINEIRELNGLVRITTKGDANQESDRDPYMVSPSGEVSKVISMIPLVGHPMVYMNTVQGRQAATTFLVIANILGIFAFVFRKKIVANFSSERVYKELYTEERYKSEQYREILKNMNEALEIEKETIERAGIK
jgi:signal peptidase I